MKSEKPKLILASASPRRIELLKMLSCQFEVIPSRIEEKVNHRLSPTQNVKQLSRLKALEVASKISDGIIISGDTLAVLNDKILGKPKNLKEAKEMLQNLSGKWHQVITGITVMDAKTKKFKQKVVRTRVKFRNLDKNLINKYISKENPWDKAGSYAIQGRAALLVESIRGDYFNVVGLPLNTLNQLLENFEVSLL